MILIRRAPTVLVTATMIFAITAGAVWAAKGTSKVYVPKNIISGASVVKGRAFYTSNIPEDSLAGIRLGRPAKEILTKWGNPSRITVASPQTEDEGASAQGGPAYTPPTATTSGMYNPYASMAPGLNMAAGILGLQNSPLPGGGGVRGLPGLPGMSAPGMPNTGQPQPNRRANVTLSEEEVTWTYDLNNGITLEFIITDGLITQVTVGGAGPWGLSKTRSGLQLGDTYKLAIWVCGYPETQKYVGRFLRVSYVNKNRALFTFLNNKLVGVTIAMVPTEITLK